MARNIVGLGLIGLAMVAIVTGCDRAATDNAGGAPVAPAGTPARALPPFVVKIDATVSGGAFPVVNGTTNLPDGTVLMLMIYGCTPTHGSWADCPPGVTAPVIAHPSDESRWPGLPQPENGPPGAFGEKVTIRNGRFVSQPWSREGGEGLFEGTYGVFIMQGAPQPPNVQAILGRPDDYGAALAGPLVKPGKPITSGLDRNGVSYVLPTPITPKNIEYVHFFEVGSEPSGA